MTRMTVVGRISAAKSRLAQERIRATGTALVLCALMLSAGCAAEGESCPVPQAPEGAREPVELAADALPIGDTDEETPAESEASPPANAGAGQSAGTAETRGDDPGQLPAAESLAQKPPRVDLVYFHTANPCGCLGEVEGVIRTALQTAFPEEMAQKQVRLFSVISDDPASENLVRMYGSQQFDLFLVTYEGDKASATQVYEIWSLLGDNEAIALVVQSRVADNLMQSG